MTGSERLRWYVVHTHPQAEAKAQLNLARQGFAVYLPRYRKRRRHARKTDVVAAPLFPRYLFVLIDVAAQRWRAIQSTIGVAQLVCQGERPAPVPHGVVESIKAREDAGGLLTLNATTQLQAGEKVRILDGVFADCLGLFEAIADDRRIAILLNLLGRQVRVLVDGDQVAAA